MFTLNVVVPTPSVTVTAPSTQRVGQPLTLTCNATTVRGITSRVDIVWSRGTNITKTIENIAPTAIRSLRKYIDTYTISTLRIDDDDREFECGLVIHASSQIRGSDIATLDVIGMYEVESQLITYGCGKCDLYRHCQFRNSYMDI